MTMKHENWLTLFGLILLAGVFVVVLAVTP